MAKAKGERRKTKYSVFRLDYAGEDQDPQSPDCEWVTIAEFDTDNDATKAAKLLEATDDYKDGTFSVVREIREIESKPKDDRRLV